MYKLIAVSVLSFILGLSVGHQNPTVNVIGNIKTELGLFGNTHSVVITFNGIEGITGVLDKNNNGHLVGLYKDKSATADCSGASIDQLICTVNYDGNTSNLKFGKQ